MLFSRSTKKFHYFLSKMSLDLHEKLHKNHSNSSKYAFKLLLENNNKISFLFLLSFQPSAAQLSQARGPASSPSSLAARSLASSPSAAQLA
jgi:hypothetical protein